MEERLPTELWVMAHVRQCISRGIAVYVVRKGAPAAGTVILRISMREKGERLLTQTRDESGKTAWLEQIVDDSAAAEYIERAVKRDPDVWVVEIDDPSGTNPFEGKIL